jgi:hypothetical protein
MARTRVRSLPDPLRATLQLACLLLLALFLGCRTPADVSSGTDSLPPAPLEDSLFPSNLRNWSPDVAVLPYAEIGDRTVTVYNIRNISYQSDSDYVVRHYDHTFDLSRLQGLDFIVVPFKGASALAHTMLSFDFRGDEHLCMSVEARLEQGEKYSPLSGSLRRYELIYVLADERDVIVRRTRHRSSDVYLYHTVATPEQARRVFVDAMKRVNKLYNEPEFYDTVTNNCTTNIVRHVNILRQGDAPYDPRILFTGLSDQLAFEQGLLKAEGTFEQTRQRANITQRSNRFADQADYSSLIRR